MSCNVHVVSSQAERSLALGLSQLVIHLLGDVPFPAVVGWVLDTLAPAVCKASDLSGSSFSNSSAVTVGVSSDCSRDITGVRWANVVAYGWEVRSRLYICGV